MSVDYELHGYGAAKRILAHGPSLGDGMQALVQYCRQRQPHPAWGEIEALDATADADAMRRWFRQRLPLPGAVQVVWFAPWDVVEGFDLRGSSSWSRDPEDWEWWYRDDFQGGGRRSPVLAEMLEIARRTEDPDEGIGVSRGVCQLTEWVLGIGFVSLAALQIMRSLDPAELLAGRPELWVVSGFPDALYGIILGRMAADGFEVHAQPA